MENPLAYTPHITPIHCIPAGVKVGMLLVYTIVLCFIQSWFAMVACVLVFIVAAMLAHLPVARIARTLAPMALILLFTLLAPALTFVPAVSFSVQGLLRGFYNVLRIVCMLGASVVLTYTTAAEDLSRFLRRMLRPLARFGFPAHDTAAVVSIALRFIPLTLDEMHLVIAAQQARGAHLYSGGIVQRARAWSQVFVPLFVGLYRRADALSVAMDARLYGANWVDANKNSRKVI